MPAPNPFSPRRTWEVLLASLQLGLTSFGGPIAHIGYFEHAFVRQRGWLTAGQHASLVSLCQVLPGPASSQYNFLAGLHRAGWPGAFAAWLGFTLPSALLLYAGALLSARAQGPLAQAALHGLKLVAVAVVAQAVPGPLFTFAAWLGAVNPVAASPAQGAAVATLFIFLPGLLVAVAGVSLWSRLARRPRAGAALAGVNAAVVGILAAALYDPVWTTAIRSGADVAIAVAGLLLLERWRLPPVVVVGSCVAASIAKELLLPGW